MRRQYSNEEAQELGAFDEDAVSEATALAAEVPFQADSDEQKDGGKTDQGEK